MPDINGGSGRTEGPTGTNDMLVIVPGILGSRLARPDGSAIWGSAAMFGNLPSLGEALHPDRPLVPSGLLADRAIVPGFWKVDGYTRLHRFLDDRLAEGGRRLVLTFPYDWRQSNEDSAGQLRRFVYEELGAWRELGHPDAKATLICHSMGGLVARWYLDVLGDDLFGDGPTTRRLITIGTPYRGAVKALGVLINGVQVPVLSWSRRFTAGMNEAVRSMPSVYELLPRYRAIAAEEGAVRLADSGAINGMLDAEQYAAACAFHEHLDAAVSQRAEEHRLPTYDIAAIVSVLQPTPQYASATRDGLQLLETLMGRNRKGDGTVPRQSVAPPEWRNEDAATFPSQKHAHLQNTDVSCHQIHGIVTTGEDWSDMAVSMQLAMHAPEAIVQGEVYHCSVDLEGEVDEDAVLVADVEGDDGSLQAVRLKPDGPRRRTASIDGLPAGLWRVTVAGPSYVEPVSDLVLVLEEGSA